MTPQKLLREAHFARALPDHVITRLAEVARVVEWNEGTLIFREGETHESFYVVCSGHVVLEMSIPGRGLTRILTVRSGEPLGWSSLLGDGRMTTNAIAIEPTQAVALAGTELRRLCEADYEVGFHVMRQVSGALTQRLLATRLQLLDLFAKPQ